MPDLLGGEERVEDPPLEPGRNPVPGIGERDLDRAGPTDPEMRIALRGRLGQGVAGIGQQVDEHLLQLDGIPDDHRAPPAPSRPSTSISRSRSCSCMSEAPAR